MYKFIVDTMGGDLGSQEVVKGILDFLSCHDDVEITAVGKIEELYLLKSKCRLIDARDIVPMEAGALETLRMKNSSMLVAIKTMKEENLDAVISCGSTGGFLSASAVTLRMIPGVQRAALVAPFPTHIKGKKVVLLDIGASNENTPEELAQFAMMGGIYAKAVYGTEEPKSYLLSNGAEDLKGTPTIKAAHKLLKESNFPGFMGNIEAREALDGRADVIVTEGFVGNVFLKTCEGVAKYMSSMFKGALTKNLWSKLGYLHIKSGMKELQEAMDYKSTGGAMLLGINGTVVKAHGSSDAYSFKCALEVAYKLTSNDVENKIKEGIANAKH